MFIEVRLRPQGQHRDQLRLIELMMRDGLAAQLRRCKSMEQGFKILKAYPMVGDFLAYQFISDINYSTLTDFSEMEFTVPGPGARDIRRCGPFLLVSRNNLACGNQEKIELRFCGKTTGTDSDVEVRLDQCLCWFPNRLATKIGTRQTRTTPSRYI